MSPKPITVVFGASGIGNRDGFKTDEEVATIFSILQKHGVNHLDSAQLYGISEQRLGEVKAGDQKFIIDTKWTGGWTGKGGSSKENIVKTAKESIERLGMKQVDIFYMHSPDAGTPIEDTLAGVDEAYKLGLFRRFGLSNYTAADVQAVYDAAKKHNYVLPTVYQGNYSPVARKQETILFPTLRKLGMAFYAYSPLAGGFLTKTKKDIADGAGRFNKDQLGGMYLEMYGKPSYLEALEKWEQAAADEGCSRADLAYRWVAYNSPLSSEFGDAVIVGASRAQQLDQTLTGLEAGPLSEKALKAIDDIWEGIKHEAPVDNFSK